MAKCIECAFRTTTAVTNYKQVYSAIHEREISIPYEQIVPACGLHSGEPVKVPVDRPACESYKEVSI